MTLAGKTKAPQAQRTPLIINITKLNQPARGGWRVTLQQVSLWTAASGVTDPGGDPSSGLLTSSAPRGGALGLSQANSDTLQSS